MENNRKILIISSDDDYDTTTVVKWLRKLNKAYFRINYQDTIRLNRIDLDTEEISLIVNGVHIDLNDFDTLFYRRGKNWKLFEKAPFDQNSSHDLNQLSSTINVHLRRENETILEFIQYKMKDKRHLVDLQKGDVNKLVVLSEAKKVGLNIPETSVVTNPKNLIKKVNEGKFITKSLASNIYSLGDELGYYTYTEKVQAADLEYRTGLMPPSLIQSMVEKFVELRIFFLEEDFYAMAIFSQLKNQSKVDCRMDGESRRVPYQLPQAVKEKLVLLMKKLELKTGSIDMIVDHQDNYIFLEVNPVGQVGMTSVPCNFNLHKKIATWL